MGTKIEVDLQGTLVNINEDSNSFFLRSSLLPRVAILVNSKLNVKIKSSGLIINASPWTIFETNDSRKPYGFTYVTHSVFQDEINNSKDWIINYVEEHEGKTMLTDFDENQNYLNAVFPLNDAVNGTILTKDIIQYSQKILSDFKRES